MNAGGSISVTAGDTISMKSTNDFTINSGKNLNISAADSITMTCRDNSVKLEMPASGIEIDAKKPIKLTGGNTVDVKSKAKFTVTSSDAFQLSVDKKLDASSSKNFNVSASQKIALSADSAIEASSKGSSIKMDGDIDMKAKLIKEN